MILWTCITAGGPDAGKVFETWAPDNRSAPYPKVASDGQPCTPYAVHRFGSRRSAVYIHPAGSRADLDSVEAVLNDLVDLFDPMP
jgi:hypothetical protein